MKKLLLLVLGALICYPLLWSQGLDEINVVEMSWLIKCYQGIRPATAVKAAETASSYSQPAFFDELGRDEDLAKEREMIRTTFNLRDVQPISREELWLRAKEPSAMTTIVRAGGPSLTILLERLDDSWLHYRIAIYEKNDGTDPVLRSAFTIPGSMTLKDALVFGFEDEARGPYFLSLRINNLFAEGATLGKAAIGDSVQKPTKSQGAGPVPGEPAVKPEIKAPRLIQRVAPVYPEAAKQAGIEGTVVLSVSLDEKGRVIRARVVKSIPELDQAALEAVRQWTYAPMTVDGVPRPIVFTVPVDFKR